MSRTNGILLNLNDKEKRYLDNFCNRYKIPNRAKFIRELLFAVIIEKTESDSPKLF